MRAAEALISSAVAIIASVRELTRLIDVVVSVSILFDHADQGGVLLGLGAGTRGRVLFQHARVL